MAELADYWFEDAGYLGILRVSLERKGAPQMFPSLKKPMGGQSF